MQIKVLAYTFPAICVVMGVLMLLSNQSVNSSELSRWGGGLIVIGASLQALYLVLRYRQ